MLTSLTRRRDDVAAHLRLGTHLPPAAVSSARGSAGPRRAVRAALGAAVAGTLLAGCMAHADLTLSAGGTYDVRLDLRDSTGVVYPVSGDDPAARCTPLADPSIVGAPAGTSVTAAPVGSADDDGGLGCEVTITGVQITDAAAAEASGSPSPAASAGGESADADGSLAAPDAGSDLVEEATSTPLVVRDGDLYVVDLAQAATALAGGLGAVGAGDGGDAGTPDTTGATDDPSAEPDGMSAAGDLAGAAAVTAALSAVDVKVTVTFPGAVVDAGDGSVSANGRSVTWTGAGTVAAGIRATGYATEGAELTWWQRHHTQVIIGMVSACVVAAGAVIIRWRRRKH